MASKTLYELIGVNPSASTKAIEDACIKLGSEYRPDKNPNDEKAARLFKFFEEAFATLTDPTKRAEYDRSIGVNTQAPRPPANVPWLMRGLVAIVMGFFSGVLIYFLSAFVFIGIEGVSPFFIFASFFGGWIGSTFLMMKGTRTVSKVAARGFLIGASEWLLMIPAGLIFSGRAAGAVLSKSGGSDAAAAGASLGVGIFTFLTGTMAFVMAGLCLIGFAVSYFIGREMKPEASLPTKKCPECAEMVQAEAKKCRYCGAVLTPQPLRDRIVES